MNLQPLDLTLVSMEVCQAPCLAKREDSFYFFLSPWLGIEDSPKNATMIHHQICQLQAFR
jgi:hypothetical protein